MNFDLPEEIVAVQESVRKLVKTRLEPEIGGYEEKQSFPYALIREMGEAGLFGAVFPEQLGGSDMGFLAVAVISETLSETVPEFGYAMNMQAMTCPFTIYNWGTNEQVEKYIPGLIAGQQLGMFALTEPGGGSDAAGSMKSTAVREGDYYVLNGSKQWITFSNVCDTGVVFAKTNPSAGHKGISAFIIEPKKTTGYQADPIAIRSLSKSMRSCSVFFDEVKIPVENRLGEEGEGFKVAMSALEYGRLTVSARLVGLAQGCLNEAIDYAQNRVIKGAAIGHYQMVQHLIADMTVHISAARLMVYRMAQLMDEGRAANRASSQAKYFASIAAKHAGQSAAEIFGGYALADDYLVSKLNGYINMLNVGEGAPAVQRILIAEDALGYKNANRHPIKNRARQESVL